MTRENIVPCPACGESIDAVETICETGACPECRTGLDELFSEASDDPDRTPEEIIDESHALEVDG